MTVKSHLLNKLVYISLLTFFCNILFENLFNMSITTAILTVNLDLIIYSIIESVFLNSYFELK